MDIDTLIGAAEITGGAALFLLLVYRQVKTGARDAWRSEAEAQTLRGDRLAAEIQEVLKEIHKLRVDNEVLRLEVVALRSENNELRRHIDALIERREDE